MSEHGKNRQRHLKVIGFLKLGEKNVILCGILKKFEFFWTTSSENESVNALRSFPPCYGAKTWIITVCTSACVTFNLYLSLCFQSVTSTESSKTWSCFTASEKTTARSRWTAKPRSSWGASDSTRSTNTQPRHATQSERFRQLLQQGSEGNGCSHGCAMEGDVLSLSDLKELSSHEAWWIFKLLNSKFP